MSNPELPDIEEARRRVAAEKNGPALEHAILSGQWDGGSLVQDALRAVQEERSRA